MSSHRHSEHHVITVQGLSTLIGEIDSKIHANTLPPLILAVLHIVHDFLNSTTKQTFIHRHKWVWTIQIKAKDFHILFYFQYKGISSLESYRSLLRCSFFSCICLRRALALCSMCRMIDLSPGASPLLTQNSRSTDREWRSILSRHPDCSTETARSGNLPINKYTVTLTVLYISINLLI